MTVIGPGFADHKNWSRIQAIDFSMAQAGEAQAVNTMSTTANAQLIILNSKEKDDLNEALPSEWTTPQHLGQATIYNMKMSPPCCKIRTIFSWYKVT